VGTRKLVRVYVRLCAGVRVSLEEDELLFSTTRVSIFIRTHFRRRSDRGFVFETLLHIDSHVCYEQCERNVYGGISTTCIVINFLF
jgi:hypothetical protein